MQHFKLTLIGMVALCAGCGSSGPAMPKTFPVKGKVTYADGTPVPTLGIRLTNEDTRFSTAAATKADGTFELKTFDDKTSMPGAFEGEHAFDVSGGPLEDNRPIQLRVVKPAKIKVKAKDNDVAIEVERVAK